MLCPVASNIAAAIATGGTMFGGSEPWATDIH